MSSKKYRKKLKRREIDRYAYVNQKYEVINYLKKRPYEWISSTDIINNTSLENSACVSSCVKAINKHTDEYIETKKGRNGGYMYYG